MIYFKEIEIPGIESIQKILLDYINIKKIATNNFWNNVYDNEIFYNIESICKDILHSQTLRKLSVISVTPEMQTQIHVDHVDCTTRLNIPLHNCEYSETVFYKSEVEPEVRLLKNGVPYLFYHEKNCHEVAKFTLTKPTVIRVNQPHIVRLTNIAIDKRIACTLELIPGLDHLLIE